jgi:hypothetical protein
MMWLEELPSHWWTDIGALEFLILGLAVWRLTSLIVNEDGPLYLFERFRYWVGVRRTEENVPYGKNVIAEGLTCVWCASVWVSLLAIVLYVIFPTQTLIVSLVLSISTISILIEKVVDCD